MVLAAFLHNQLDRNEFRMRPTHARLRRSADTYYVPDIAMIPNTDGAAHFASSPEVSTPTRSRYPWSSNLVALDGRV